MEGLAAMLILIPILVPAAMKLGIDPIQFGLMNSRSPCTTPFNTETTRNSMVTEQFKGRLQVFRYITDAEAAAEKAQKSASNAGPSPSAEAKP